MGQQHALAERMQQRRVGQQRDATVGQPLGADQKVAVAVHEGDGATTCRLAQHRRAFGLEAFATRIVADPGLEQITEDEDGIGRRAGQVLSQGVEGRGRQSAKMQIAQHIDRLPHRRRDKVVEAARRGRLPWRIGQTTTALVMTTSSSGTSSWPPLRPVLTPPIASTMSCPPTTLPKTA